MFRSCQTKYRSCQTKGARVCLSTDQSLLPQLFESKLLPEDPLVWQFGMCAPWKLIHAVDHGETQHVGLQEVKEMLWAFGYHSKLSLYPLRGTNLADSMVSIGAWAHGRSSVFVINRQLRKHVGWEVLGKHTMENLYIRSEFNCADDPTRDVPLREPKPAPDWLVPHLIRENAWASSHYSMPMKYRLFIECYAGLAGLTRALHAYGILCGTPCEAYDDRGKLQVSEKDLDDELVVGRLCNMILAGLVWYIHFGVPCTTWGLLARLNYTRTRESPDGSWLGPEVKANKQVETVCQLAHLLHQCGCYYSIENPAGNTLFWYPRVVELGVCTGANIVYRDQCAYNLQLPGAKSNEFVLKSIQILTNMPALTALERRCPGTGEQHLHVHAWGGFVHQGKRISRAKAAGRYPSLLCNCWAAGAVATLRGHHAD